MTEKNARQFLAIGLTACVLCVAGVDRSFRKEPADTKPYHQSIVKAAQAAPTQIGDWIGSDVPTPEAAIKLLRPNVIVSKRYVNYVTGEEANFLLVDCSDARDLQGHYPPVCYPNQGWIEMSHESHDWQVGNLLVTGTQYEFTTKTPVEINETVANFMLLPEGKIGRDMDSVRAAAKDLQDRYYGAAQVQVIMDSNLAQARKDEIVQTMVGGYRNLIGVIIGRGDK